MAIMRRVAALAKMCMLVVDIWTKVRIDVCGQPNSTIYELIAIAIDPHYVRVG